MARDIRSPFAIGDVGVANRVALAPMAGIGAWFVRLQARRLGAGLVFSEMVSSLGIEYGNRRTLEEYLHIDPDEHPVAIQLFGGDADVMARAAERAAAAGADLIDVNMGCPVRKVCRSGAGAALLGEPQRAVAVARAAAAGAGVPVTVKLRSGLRPGGREGEELARRLAADAGVAALTIHPRPAAVQHRGAPDYEAAGRLARSVGVPVLVSGGLTTAQLARRVFDETGCAAIMLARGAVGNPWLFREVLHGDAAPPEPDEVAAELRWLIDRAVAHWGDGRGVRKLRQVFPGYLRRLRLGPAAAQALMEAGDRRQAEAVLSALVEPRAPAGSIHVSSDPGRLFAARYNPAPR